MFIDNKKVKDNHQQGISRVLQRKGDLKPGQGGKMHNKPEKKSNWKRPDNTLPPVGA